MKHLVIIGAGGYGREMYGAALGAVGYATAFDVKGYLDARADALEGFAGYPPVIGSPETGRRIAIALKTNVEAKMPSAKTKNAE